MIFYFSILCRVTRLKKEIYVIILNHEIETIEFSLLSRKLRFQIKIHNERSCIISRKINNPFLWTISVQLQATNQTIDNSHDICPNLDCHQNSMGLLGVMGSVGLVGLVSLVGLMSLFCLVGLMCYLWLFLGVFWLFWPKIFSNGSMVFDDPKWLNMTPKSSMVCKSFKLT